MHRHKRPRAWTSPSARPPVNEADRKPTQSVTGDERRGRTEAQGVRQAPARSLLVGTIETEGASHWKRVHVAMQVPRQTSGRASPESSDR